MGRKIKTKIVGVTYSNDDGTNRQDLLAELSDGDRLELVDCSSDRYPEAIGVFNEAGEQIGNLSKSLANELRDSGENFENYGVTVLTITGGGDVSYGCNIEIDTDDFFLCLMSLHDAGAMSFKSPLLKTPNTVSEDISGKIHLEASDNSYSVYSDDGTLLGFLPSDACKQIISRHLDISTCSGAVLDTMMDSKGDLHVRVNFKLLKEVEKIKPTVSPVSPVKPVEKTTTSEPRITFPKEEVKHHSNAASSKESKKGCLTGMLINTLFILTFVAVGIPALVNLFI